MAENSDGDFGKVCRERERMKIPELLRDFDRGRPRAMGAHSAP
jgi:hypothetical protein